MYSKISLNMNKNLLIAEGEYFSWPSNPSDPTLCRVIKIDNNCFHFEIVGQNIELKREITDLRHFKPLTQKQSNKLRQMGLKKCKDYIEFIKRREKVLAKLRDLRRKPIPLS